MRFLLITLWFYLSYLKYGLSDDTQYFTFVEEVSKYGYLVETNEVETEDGYLLEVYRVPFGKTKISKNPNKLPIIVCHALLGSAEEFLVGGPKEGLIYALADNGYDVWVLNTRGSWHSRKHKRLNPDTSKEFWKFTFHEIGYYDIPAVIEYITIATGEKKMHYIGYSQGSTAFFAMCASRAEYNGRIKLMVALAPTAILTNIRHPLLKFLAPIYPILLRLTETLGIYELFPHQILSNNDARDLGKDLCINGTTFNDICSYIIYFLLGFDEEQLDPDSLRFILGTHPGGASILQFVHYAQIINKGDFYQYDWGRRKNLKKYGMPNPPKYNLNNVVVPISLFYGDGDIIVTKEDVKILSTILPNVVELYRVPWDKWTHGDFFVSKNKEIYLHNHIIEFMRKFNG